MNTFPTFFDAAAFDWISLAFWIIIALRMLIGFFKGGFKTLFKIIVLGVAIGLAFALCKVVGTWIGNMGLHNMIANGLVDKIGNIDPTLSQEMTRGKLNIMYGYWKASGGVGTMDDMIMEMLHKGYSSTFIPTGIYENLDKIIIDGLPPQTDLTTPFTFAGIMSNAIADMALIGIGFILTFLVILIIGLVIVFVVSRGAKLAGHKPGMVSRIIGVVLGLAYGIFLCWTASILLKSFMTAFPVFNDFINKSMQLDNDGYWNIGKFFFGLNFGYADLLNWFLSLIGTKS